MDVTARIKQERGMDTIAGIVPCGAASATEVAVQFGLSGSSECYQEIDALEAALVLENVLHRDMAYGVEIMPLAMAKQLAAKFIDAFSGTSACFFTNGGWGRPQVTPGVGPGWSPATAATFDTGVIVVSGQQVGCVWCLDED